VSVSFTEDDWYNASKFTFSGNINIDDKNNNKDLLSTPYFNNVKTNVPNLNTIKCEICKLYHNSNVHSTYKDNHQGRNNYKDYYNNNTK